MKLSKIYFYKNGKKVFEDVYINIAYKLKHFLANDDKKDQLKDYLVKNNLDKQFLKLFKHLKYYDEWKNSESITELNEKNYRIIF